jgi:signal transduction histidine kinase
MSLRPPIGLAAVLVAAAAALIGVVVWWNGTVSLGMTLAARDGAVVVADVTPHGHAARWGWMPGLRVIDLTTVDGSEVRRAVPVRTDHGDIVRAPTEAVDSARIGTAVADDGVAARVSIHREVLERDLAQTIWVVALGLAVAAAAAWALLHGLAGEVGLRVALPIAASVVASFGVLPLLAAGSAGGIIAAALVPAGVACLAGVALGITREDRTWARTAVAAAVLATALTAILVGRSMTSTTLETGDRGLLQLLVAAIAAVPAMLAAAAPGLPGRARATLVSLGLVPGAAFLVASPAPPEPALPIALIALLLGWPLLPVERMADVAAGLAKPVRPRGPMTEAGVAASALSPVRDALAALLLGMAVFYGLTRGSVSAAVIGAALAGGTWLAVRAGFLGRGWTDAAVPLAAAVGVPVVLSGAGWPSVGWAYPVTTGAVALSALAVGHVLAIRHPSRGAGLGLLVGTVAVVLAIGVLGISGSILAVPLLGLVALVPGLPIAFADRPGSALASSSRLEALAIALTPGAAATVLVPMFSWVLLAAWLVALVVWRRFTLEPLVGIAQRTQLQRDLAVAAAETERARLAAELHDDPIQQLTMLVRRLDEGGHADAAAEAREVADKLRAVVGDLRVPILDDLGAGAALEWLVERVEPLAGGPVRLERTDEGRPPPEVELAVFRVAQEAVANAIRHGRPPVALRYDVRPDGRVTLAVDDAGDGIGAEAATEATHDGHFGLLNMRQRAEQIGALLDVRAWPGGGTRVVLEWRPS